MRFGDRVRILRISKRHSRRALGQMIGVSFICLSKNENEKINFGDCLANC